MNNKIVLKQDLKLTLSKTENLFNITNKILNDKLDFLDNSWIQKLWDWADKNKIDNLYEDYENYYDRGLPRDKEKLLLLKELNLSNYNLKNIPKELFYLENLEYLDLSNNQITNIPDLFIKFKNLQHLDLSNNNISIVSIVLAQMNSLTTLILNNNIIKNISNEFIDQIKIKYFEIKNNPLIFTDKLNNYLEEVKLNECQSRKLFKEALDALSKNDYEGNI